MVRELVRNTILRWSLFPTPLSKALSPLIPLAYSQLMAAILDPFISSHDSSPPSNPSHSLSLFSEPLPSLSLTLSLLNCQPLSQSLSLAPQPLSPSYPLSTLSSSPSPSLSPHTPSLFPSLMPSFPYCA